MVLGQQWRRAGHLQKVLGVIWALSGEPTGVIPHPFIKGWCDTLMKLEFPGHVRGEIALLNEGVVFLTEPPKNPAELLWASRQSRLIVTWIKPFLVVAGMGIVRTRVTFPTQSQVILAGDAR